MKIAAAKTNAAGTKRATRAMASRSRTASARSAPIASESERAGARMYEASAVGGIRGIASARIA